MTRLVPLFHRLLLPLLGALALGLAGCADKDRLNSATEVDEPNYREGQALLKTGRKQEALTAFLKVISARGDDAPESHLEIGLLYLQHTNDPLSAIYHFKKYLALRPNSPQAPLVKQRIDAATREFARMLPAQPLEGQPQRVDLVAALDRMKQENEALKQELADLKAGRNLPALAPASVETPADAPAVVAASPSAFTFNVDTMPTVRTRPTSARLGASAPVRVTTAPVQSAPAAVTVTPAPARAATVKKHVVRPGDSLSKISMQYYGNRTRVKDLYAANRGIMKSETDLKVGMELKLP